MASITKYESAELFAGEAIKTEIKTMTYYQPIHWHNFFELEYIVEGDGECIINGVSHKIESHTLFLSTPSDFHELKFNKDTKIINLQFLPEMLNPEIYHILKNPIVFNDSKAAFFNYITPICSYGPQSGNYNKMFVKYMLNATLFLISSQYIHNTGKMVYQINDYFHKTIMYINNHFDEELTLADLAKKVNLTPEYMSRIFKKHSGQRLSDYITNVRMNHAYNLVINTVLSINEIAVASGYNSCPHFIREFKKKYGNSPNKLRKEYKSQ